METLSVRFCLLTLVLFISSCQCSAGSELVNTGRSVASELLGVLTCGFQAHPMDCVKDKAAKILDLWEGRLDDEMRSWGDEADKEYLTSGRQLSNLVELPSEAGQKLRSALNELANIFQRTVFKSEARKKEEGGFDEITISTSQDSGHKKKKKKKKKKKPSHIHIHPHQSHQQSGDSDMRDEDKGSLEMSQKTLINGLWVDEELVGPLKTRIKREENDSKDLEDARGKRKKKKKAILKLLLLGAVLKAKLSLLLQLFSAHLQVKFFTIALAGLAINIARFYFDLRRGNTPQKVIYYEHAQHQHHYDHEDHGWGGYWSRNFENDPKQTGSYSPNPADSSSQSDELAYGGWTGRSQTRRK